MLKIGSSIVFVIVLCMVLVFTGCQAAKETVEDNSVTEVDTLPIPYSRGPSGPPSVKGPSSAPPGVELVSDTPQAVVEVEDVRITLPEN